MTCRAIIWATGLEQAREPAALGPVMRGERPKLEPFQTPEPRQSEEEADHKQEHEHEHMKRHQNPRCFKWEAWRSSLRSKDAESHQGCQASGS
jgi:hypothetical protein